MFVDATGRRRRRMRRIAYAVGAACLTYTGLVAASVIGQTRPGPLTLLPTPMARSHEVVRQTRPPKPATSGVPLPAGDPRRPEEVPMGLQSRGTDRPSAPRPQRAAARPRTESTPRRTPTVALPSPTGPLAPTEPPYRPWPEAPRPEPSLVGHELDLPSAKPGPR